MGRKASTLPLIILLLTGCSSKKENLLLKGQELLVAREYPKALRQFQELIQRYPEFAPGYFGLGKAYFELASLKESTSPEDYDDAAQAYELGLKYEPNSIGSHLSLGIIHTRKALLYDKQNHSDKAHKERLKALHYLTNVLVLEPNYARAYYRLGVLYREAGKTERAIYHFNRATQLAPRDPEPYYELARIYKSQNKLEDAVRNLRTAVGLRPAFLEARLLLGDTLYKLGRLADAIPHLALVATQRRELLSVRKTLAECYKKTGKLKRALKEYQNLLSYIQDEKEKEDYKTEIESLQQATDFLEKAEESLTDNPSFARELIEKVLARYPSSPRAHFLNSKLLEDRPEEALKELKFAYKFAPYDRDVVSELANLYFKLQKYKDCAELVKKFVEQQELAPLRLLRARALVKLGKLPDAHEEYSIYLSLAEDPKKIETARKELLEVKKKLFQRKSPKEETKAKERN